MYEFAIIWDWLAFAVRWLHVITGIAWIGSSFYFVALDLGLKKVPHLPPGAYGEEWQVHGGGFYHIQKYLVAPERMPEHLVWFKWESYATWLSGFAMLGIVYYAGADLFLVDRAVWDVPAWAAILISLASLVGRLDALRQPLQVAAGEEPDDADGDPVRDPRGDGLGLHPRLHRAGGAAAPRRVHRDDHVGERLPRHHPEPDDRGRRPQGRADAGSEVRRDRQAALDAQQLPDAAGAVPDASNHYPLAFATEWNWLIASLVFLMGVTIRHYFNTMHATGKTPNWTWAATAIIFVIIMWLSSAPGSQREELAGLSPIGAAFAWAEGFDAGGGHGAAAAARCATPPSRSGRGCTGRRRG